MISILGKSAEVIPDPWPHVVIEEALPEDLYIDLLQTRLSPERIVSLSGRPEKGNSRYDVSASQLLKSEVADIWKRFVAYHVSHQFWQDILRVFGEVIKELHPTFDITEPVGTRLVHPAPILLDCQMGINTPALTYGRVRGPHIDNSAALFAGLLYMGNTAGGDLLLQRWRGKRTFTDKFEIADRDVETVACVPYRHNTFVAFINSPDAIHAVTPRHSPEHRLLCNLVVDSAKGKLFKI